MPLTCGYWELDNFYDPTKNMEKMLTDCYFYYYSSCRNGDQCQYRHEPSALGHEIMCNRWLENRCFNVQCKHRHMRIGKKRNTIPCFWENTSNGCTKPHCVFLHTKSNNNNNDNAMNQNEKEQQLEQAVDGVEMSSDVDMKTQQNEINTQDVESMVTSNTSDGVENSMENKLNSVPKTEDTSLVNNSIDTSGIYSNTESDMDTTSTEVATSQG